MSTTAETTSTRPTPGADEIEPRSRTFAEWAQHEPSFRTVLGLRAVILACLLVAWQLLHALEVGGPGTIPSVPGVVRELAAVTTEAGFASVLWQTVGPWLLGLVIVVVGGVAIGVVLGTFSFAYRSTRATIDFVRSFPPVAVIPLAVLTLGVSTKLKVVFIVATCIWPMVLQTIVGVRSVDPISRQAARSMRLSWWQAVRWVVLPATMPYVATGLRISAVMALLVTIGVEILGGVAGLGQSIATFEAAGDVDTMWGYLLTAMLLGVIVSQGFSRLERFALRWHASQR
ncbi:putative ABC-type nitrate/sulfonate/bicarbonate transport system permease component [Patulibacter medicamentivorans]|uniref:Putative ABC-type nitrate/sulfonate/bicarbonate transport system permease component n=1 Tax=Patulibacter medicamentivorans TaxID=1097667 RepID=H0E067_9ACTN|nr:ABC transporter permease subunit [Patulibacter medicamentivorans]EHN12870.1 putative ABC-type nitrate/sulfonate/bicarbonate transport system permease component [Patulibacter medicamentivorans]